MSKKLGKPIKEPNKLTDVLRKKIKRMMSKWLFLPLATKYDNIDGSDLFTVTLFGETQEILNEIQADTEPFTETQFVTNYNDIGDNLQTQFKTSVGIIPEILPEAQASISQDYSENLKMYIKNFGDNEIMELRNQITIMLNDGASVKEVKDYIAGRYNVSENKAKFLARNETKQYMVAFQKTQFEAAGIDTFEWHTAEDNRVRHSHKILDKQIFTWSKGAIDEKTGETIFPGSDYNCRCVAKPIITWK